jgi:dTDP-4-amino-4,6-dideoxygalactose transaminase
MSTPELSELKAPPRALITQAPWPVFDEDQVNAVSDVLRSGKVNYWTGQVGREFEKEFAAWCGSKKSLAISNGTATLELILRGLRLKPGDEVITTPRTFIASSSACAFHGIKPVLADIDTDSGNITPETVAPLITNKTRAILPVHLGGWPCDMEGFLELAEKHKLHIIEDCAQAHGAAINGKSVGTWGIANSWSFCQDKIMTTGGEGGMVTTDDEELWARMWSLKDHGKNYDTVYNRPHPPGFRWLHETWGTNWRMTEMQAALGRVQIQRMPDWHIERKANAERFLSHLSELGGIRIPLPDAKYTHAWYRLYVYVRPETMKDGWNRDRIQSECGARGVNLSVGSCSEIYKERAFQMCHLGPSQPLQGAAELTDTAIAFLVHPGLTPEMIDETASIFAEVVRQATR